MKTILLWDQKFPDRRARRLSVADAVAFALVRAGVAAAADPADAGALALGALALDPIAATPSVQIVLQHGNGSSTARVTVPVGAASIAVGAGVGAAVSVPVASVIVTPTPTPTLTLSGALSYAADAQAGVTVATIANVPAGVTPAISPADGRMVIGGDATAGWKVVKGMTASTAGTISITVSAAGATPVTQNVTVSAAAGLDPTRPMFSSNRYYTPYGEGATGQGAGGVMAGCFYDDTSPTDEYAVQWFFPAFYNTVGGVETLINNTLKIRFAIGYGPTRNPSDASTVWVRGTIKGQLEYSLTSADAPGVLSDPIIDVTAKIPAGYHRWIKVSTVTSDGRMPLAIGCRGSTLEGGGGASADGSYWTNYLTNRVHVGGNYNAYGPSYRTSRGPAGRVAYLIGGADSKAFADAGTNPNSFENGVRGYIARGLNTDTGVGRRFSAPIAVPGANPGAWVKNADGTVGQDASRTAQKIASVKMHPEQPWSHGISQHGLNNGLGTGAAFLSGMKDYYAKLKVIFPGTPWYGVTIPSTVNGQTTVGGYQTQAGMAPDASKQADFRPGGHYYEYNAAMRANRLDGSVDGIIDAAILFNGDASSAKSPDPTLPRVYEGPLVDTVAFDATGGSEVRVTNPALWSIGDTILIDPAGISVTGLPTGLINAINGDKLSIANGNTALAKAGMVITSCYLFDRLHNTKAGDDLQIPAVVAFKNARG